MYSPGAAAALERLRVLETADRERAAAEAAAEVATRHQERAYHRPTAVSSARVDAAEAVVATKSSGTKRRKSRLTVQFEYTAYPIVRAAAKAMGWKTSPRGSRYVQGLGSTHRAQPLPPPPSHLLTPAAGRTTSAGPTAARSCARSPSHTGSGRRSCATHCAASTPCPT